VVDLYSRYGLNRLPVCVSAAVESGILPPGPALESSETAIMANAHSAGRDACHDAS
jgi:hypothetical protein